MFSLMFLFLKSLMSVFHLCNFFNFFSFVANLPSSIMVGWNICTRVYFHGLYAISVSFVNQNIVSVVSYKVMFGILWGPPSVKTTRGQCKQGICYHHTLLTELNESPLPTLALKSPIIIIISSFFVISRRSLICP